VQKHLFRERQTVKLGFVWKKDFWLKVNLIFSYTDVARKPLKMIATHGLLSIEGFMFVINISQ
jgi:hypothetical protein